MNVIIHIPTMFCTIFADEKGLPIVIHPSPNNNWYILSKNFKNVKLKQVDTVNSPLAKFIEKNWPKALTALNGQNVEMAKAVAYLILTTDWGFKLYKAVDVRTTAKNILEGRISIYGDKILFTKRQDYPYSEKTSKAVCSLMLRKNEKLLKLEKVNDNTLRIPWEKYVDEYPTEAIISVTNMFELLVTHTNTRKRIIDIINYFYKNRQYRDTYFKIIENFKHNRLDASTLKNYTGNSLVMFMIPKKDEARITALRLRHPKLETFNLGEYVGCVSNDEKQIQRELLSKDKLVIYDNKFVQIAYKATIDHLKKSPPWKKGGV